MWIVIKAYINKGAHKSTHSNSTHTINIQYKVIVAPFYNSAEEPKFNKELTFYAPW